MLVSRFRTPVDIIGMTTDVKIWRRLAMSWGVTPILSEAYPNMDVMFYCAKGNVTKALDLQRGDNILLTGGPINGQSGNTNTIKVETI
jgi:pyruvate kinase